MSNINNHSGRARGQRCTVKNINWQVNWSNQLNTLNCNFFVAVTVSHSVSKPVRHFEFDFQVSVSLSHSLVGLSFNSTSRVKTQSQTEFSCISAVTVSVSYIYTLESTSGRPYRRRYRELLTLLVLLSYC